MFANCQIALLRDADAIKNSDVVCDSWNIHAASKLFCGITTS